MASSTQSLSLRSAVLGLLDRGRLEEKIFFVHIPKCGGVSISNAIARQYGLGARLGRNAFNVDPAASSRAAREFGSDTQEFRRYITRYAASLQEVRYLSGHVQFGVDALPEEWHLVTVLRDPVEKWFSQYFYNRYKASQHSRVEQDLEEFVTTPAAREYGEDYLRYLGSWRCREALSVEHAAANLKRFSVVGVLEELDSFAAAFRRRFGVSLRIPRRNSNPVPRRAREEMVAEGVRRKVEELCRPNRAVYEEARRLVRL